MVNSVKADCLACYCLRMNFIGLLSALSGHFDASKFPDKLDKSVDLHFLTSFYIYILCTKEKLRQELIKYDVNSED